MPLYFLHVRNGDDLARDEEGEDFADLAAARLDALEAAQEMWGDLSADVARARMSIEITDETGRLLSTVPFMEAGERLAQGTGLPIDGTGCG